MHAGRYYRVAEFIRWTRTETIWLVVLAVVPVLLFQVFGWTFLAVPWVPIAMVGTAAAFIIGFKNTQTYNRLWEARQIYGAIVNASRSWGILVKDFVRSGAGGDAVLSDAQIRALHQQLIYRHIAWLTALRFQLREERGWESIKNHVENIEYAKLYKVDEWERKLDDALVPFLAEEERKYVLSKKNRATHLISLQSDRLKHLAAQGLISELPYMELEKMLVNLYDQQGKCERLKNFPYPRQFATLNLYFIRIFIFLVPFGMLNEFHKLGPGYVWLTIPFSIVVGWVFNAMERIGESTENPFEGGPNDIPITSMSRTIEIDLREMLDEADLPPAIGPVNNILM